MQVKSDIAESFASKKNDQIKWKCSCSEKFVVQIKCFRFLFFQWNSIYKQTYCGNFADGWQTTHSTDVLLLLLLWLVVVGCAIFNLLQILNVSHVNRNFGVVNKITIECFQQKHTHTHNKHELLRTVQGNSGGDGCSGHNGINFSHFI